MTKLNLLKREMALVSNLSSRPQIDSWGLKDLIGFHGMDTKQLWDSLAHSLDKIIPEVQLT